MEQLYTIENIILFSLYGAAIMLALSSGIYLLLRRNNAFSDNISPPLRLRRWTVAFFAAAAASLLWWLFIHYTPYDGDPLNRTLLCSALDAITTMPTMFCTLLVMLQDRRRPLWPVAIVEALTLFYLLMIYLFGDWSSLVVILLNVLIFLCVIVTLLMALRQYDRWLHDNYADLEHKEVWQVFLVMTVFLLTGVSYNLANNYFFFEVFNIVIDIIVIVLLLWRVETMPILEEPDEITNTPYNAGIVFEKIELLLQMHCVDTHLYLTHNIPLSQLAAMLGTNTRYLSNYFAQQGTSYNKYINDLRIQYFISLYKKSVKSKHFVKASELAIKSGFRSYNTFSRAFKEYSGQSVREWMRSCTN